MTAAWKALGEALRRSDGANKFASTSSHPVEAMVNDGVSAKAYADILIQSLDWPMEHRELEMVVRALSEKGLTHATERLLRFFNDSSTPLSPAFLWVVGSAVHTIGGRDHLTDILAICRATHLGTARQMLVVHLSRFKRDEEVYETLVSLLGDETVRGHALEALWRFGDARAIPSIEATPVRRGLYEAKARNTALKRLQRAESGRGGRIAPATPPTPPGVRVRTGRFRSDN